jgi:catechol 2,3-dioxygenase-like lactoylglutathione lyase family enzyme
MITRLDHVTIAVRDLDTTTQCFERLGFTVVSGGINKTLAAESSFVYLGTTYLEFMAHYDPIHTLEVLPNAGATLNILDVRDAVIVDFCVDSADIEQDVEILQDTGLVVDRPMDIKRILPGGNPLDVRLFFPGGRFWRQPWPFLYQRLTAVQGLLPQWRVHAIGATELESVALGVKDLERVSDIYRHRFGFERYEQDSFPVLHARREKFRIGPSTIDILAPSGEGRLQNELNEAGEGVFSVVISVKDVHQSHDFLEQQGVGCIWDDNVEGTLLIDPRETFGIYFLLK